MEKTKETMTVTAEAASVPGCLVMAEIADRIAEELELAAEFDFEYGEDAIAVKLAKEFYLRGAYRESVMVLFLTFSLVDDGEAAMLLDVVLGCGDDKAAKSFLDSFLVKYGKLPPEGFVLKNRIEMS